MNRLISTGVAEVRPDLLPPATRKGPLRILFLSIHALGWRTFGRQLEQYAATRDDVDACHVRLIPPIWMKLLNRAIPFIGKELAPPPTTWRWQVARWLKTSLPLDRFDVVFASPLPVGSALMNRAFRGRVKLAASLDCTDLQFRRDLTGQSEKSPLRVQTEREGYKEFDLLAPWSEWAADSLRNDYGIDDNLIHVCSPAVAAHVEAAARREIERASLVNILFVGADFERKGGPQLLRWHQKHFADRATLHVVSGKAQVNNAARNVVWHGAVPNERLLAEILPAMDLFVFPTQCDMFGIVIVEAAAFGLPAVASRIAAIPEIIEDQETGFLCAPADEAAFIDSIGRLIDDRALRQRMSVAARQRVTRQFTPEAQFGPLFDRFVELGSSR